MLLKVKIFFISNNKKARGAYRFIFVVLSISLIYCSAYGENQQKESADRPSRTECSSSYFLLPREIVESYFPAGDNYVIPDTPRVSSLLNRAENYTESGNYPQASRCYYLAYRRSRGTAAAPYIRFKQSYVVPDMDSSVQCLKEIIKEYPSFPLINAVKFELARRLFIAEEYGAAKQYLEQIIETEKDSQQVFTAYVYTFLGIISLHRKNYSEAVDSYIRALKELTSEQASMGAECSILKNYLELSRALIVLEKVTEAKEILKRLVGSADVPVIAQEALFLLARLYYQTEEKPRAKYCFSLLTRNYPQSIFYPDAEKFLQKLGEEKSVEVGLINDPSVLRGSYLPGDYQVELQPEGGPYAPAGGAYQVQVGSFTKKENAQQLVQKLLEKGFEAFLTSAVVNSTEVYRVRAGGFATEQEAQKASSRLNSMGYPGYVIKSD
ncbi:MAG: SPOR domain-containing protein [Spirochaetota bacterium]